LGSDSVPNERPGIAARSTAFRKSVASFFAPKNLSRRASLTSLASSLDYVAGIAVQFIINPLLVHGLGSALYGAWRVLYSLNGYLWATSGRSAQALTWVMAHNHRSASDEEKRRYVGSAIVVWFIFLPLLALVGGLGAWFAPHFLKMSAQYVGPVRFAAALLTADAILLTLLSIPRSALQGENLGYKRMGASALLIVAGGGLMALAIILHTGIVGVALANAIDTLMTGLLFWQVTRRSLSWWGFARPTRPNVRWFLGLSAWFTGWKFIYELMTAGDVVVLGVFGSVELVTIYSLTKFTTQSLVPLIGVVFEGTSPGLGAIIGSGDKLKAVRLRNEIMSITWVLCTVLGASLLLWNRSFVGIWAGQRFYAGAFPMLLIVLMLMQFVFVGNDARIIDLTLKLRGKVLLGAISAVLSVVLAGLFIKIFTNQIVGMAVGMIAGRMIVTVGYPMLIGRMLDYPLTTQIRGLLRPIAASAVIFALTMWLGKQVTTHSWVALIGLGMVTAMVLVFVASVLGLNEQQRIVLWARLRKLRDGSKGSGRLGPPTDPIESVSQ
jgi:O-antigen/teichoic acid export membrane protein